MERLAYSFTKFSWPNIKYIANTRPIDSFLISLKKLAIRFQEALGKHVDKKNGVYPTRIPPRIASNLSYCALVAKESVWNLSNDIAFTSSINCIIMHSASSISFNKFFRYTCISLITAGACLKASSPNVHALGDKFCVASCSDASGNDRRCDSQQHPPYRRVTRALFRQWPRPRKLHLLILPDVCIRLRQSRDSHRLSRILDYRSQIPELGVELDKGKVFTAH